MRILSLSAFAVAAVLQCGATGLAQSDERSVVIVNAQDAPAELVDVRLAHPFDRGPEVAIATVRNKGREALTVVRLIALIFDEHGVVKQALLSGWSDGPATPPGGPIPGFGRASIDINVRAIAAHPEWKIAVAIDEASTARSDWVFDNHVLLTLAQARLH